MVKNKHFKALVRERMAKTGERYTAARLHVEASRATLPSEVGILPGYPQVPVGPDALLSQYDAALWRRVLGQASVVDPVTGAPFTATMLAGLAGGIGFMMATFAYKNVTTATVVLRAHPEPYTERLLERVGVTFHRTSTGSQRVAEETLDKVLDSGRVAVVRVTHGALPWIASEHPESQDSIDIAVVGRTGDSFLIDGGGPCTGDDDDRLWHWVTRAELATARGRRKSDKHWAVSVASDSVSPTLEQLVNGVRASISETTGRMLGEVPLNGIPASWLSKFGVQGMLTWAGLLRDTRTKHGWSVLFADQERRRTGLEMLQSIASGPRWSGRGALRSQYADFLAESSTLAGEQNLSQLADTYRDLGLAWDAFIDTINPEVASNDRDSLFAAMADRLEALAAAEEHAARHLRRITLSE